MRITPVRRHGLLLRTNCQLPGVSGDTWV